MRRLLCVRACCVLGTIVAAVSCGTVEHPEGTAEGVAEVSSPDNTSPAAGLSSEKGAEHSKPPTDEPLAQGGESAEPAPAAGTENAEPVAAVAPVELGPGTRRSGEGLDPALSSYVVWFRLDAPAGVEPAAKASPEVHPEQFRTHVRLSRIEDESPGAQLPIPVPAGTRLVRESKHPADDFVRRVDVMERGADGWTFASYARERPAEGFQRLDTSGDCAACHGRQGGTDQVFSTPRLID